MTETIMTLENKKICPFFGTCGGCLYQDMPVKQYIQMKLDDLGEALAHKAIEVNPEPLITLPLETRRRATFSFSKGRFGYHEMKSHTIVEITECLLLLPSLQRLIAPLRGLSRKLTGDGEIFILMTEWGADICITDKNKKYPALPLIEAFNAFCNTYGVARLTYNNEPVFFKTLLPFPQNVFMQPSADGERVLTDLVLGYAAGGKKVADLFCGMGTFTLPLMRAGFKTVGYDSNALAIESLIKRGANAKVLDLFRDPLTAEELNKFDTVVLDPARAGAADQCAEIALSKVQKLIMVSCHTGTFARDARILLNAGWILQKITPVDQFPFSKHLETVSLFTK